MSRSAHSLGERQRVGLGGAGSPVVSVILEKEITLQLRAGFPVFVLGHMGSPDCLFLRSKGSKEHRPGSCATALHDPVQKDGLLA